MSGVRGRLKALSVVVAVALVSSAWTPSAAADTVDGAFDGVGRLDAGEVVEVQVLGRGGVPTSGVGSVALNVTVTNPTIDPFVTVWPTGQPMPTASNLNVVRAQTDPNMVIVPVGAGGKVSLSASVGTTDLLVDVLGWFPVGGGFTGVTPARLMDSRPGGVTVDGLESGVGAGSSFDVQVTGRGAVPASGVGSVALNVTLVDPTAQAFVTVWPTGAERPLASNLNVVPGQTVPGLVVVPVGAGGEVSVFVSSGTAHVVVDVLGWFAEGSAFTGLVPARLMDTRPGGPTTDGRVTGGGPVLGGSVIELPVVGRGGVSSGAVAVALNVTVAGATAPAYVTVWPSGSARPLASNLNVVPGQIAPNMVLVPLSGDGEVSLFLNAGAAHVIVDVLGYTTTTSLFTGLVPARLLDTRGPKGYVPFPAGVSAGGVAFDGASLWMTGADGLTRVDPVTGWVVETVPMPVGTGQPNTVLIDGTYLWTANTADQSVSRLDLATRRFVTFDMTWGSAGPLHLALAGQYVWVSSSEVGALTRIDRRTGARRNYPVDVGNNDIGPMVFDGRNLWFAVLLSRDLFRFDTTTGVTTRVPLAADRITGYPTIAWDGRRVWTTTAWNEGTQPRRSLAWFDPAAGTSGEIALPAEMWDVRFLHFDGTSLWAASSFVEPIAKVSPDSGQVELVTVHDRAGRLDPPWSGHGDVMFSDASNLWVVNGESLSFVPR